MTLDEQLEHLRLERAKAMDLERVSRDAAFLHTDSFPVCENIGIYQALPLTLFHCNLLRFAGSPFLPPFGTPGPVELSQFLWIVSPHFRPGYGREAVAVRKDFLKTCRRFVRPATPKYRLSWRNIFYTRRAGRALGIFTETVEAARDYVRDAFYDKPPAGVNPHGLDAPEYYSDFCAMAHDLQVNYPGMDYQRIMRAPLKVLYQFVKAIKEQNAAENGKPAVLWNGSDRYNDVMLSLVNKLPVSAEDASLLKLN